MMKRLGIEWLFVVLAWAFAADAVSAQPLTPREPLVEHVRPVIPVGGAEIVGVLAGGGGGPVDPERLTVNLLEPGLGSLCVTVRSRDGRYWGRAEFDVSSTPTAAPDLAWETRHASFLREFARDDLAVLARLASCAGSGGGPAVPAVWGGNAAGSEVVLMLNVGTVDEVVLSSRDGETRGSCRRFSEGRSVAYDTRCSITLAAGRHQLRLVTFHFESRAIHDFEVMVR